MELNATQGQRTGKECKGCRGMQDGGGIRGKKELRGVERACRIRLHVRGLGRDKRIDSLPVC